ncbi:MAG: peptide/nickel transport system substrate-binding protein [Bacillota bacterium]|nr:MAG: peptide/nickel transport system substrate-binding protein [Bacillota bacterium]
MLLRKCLVVVVVVAMLLIGYVAPAISSASQVPIKVIVNGKELMNLEVPPIMQNARVLVPFRAIFEALDAKVGWNDSTSLVSGYLGRTAVFLVPGQKTAWLNGAAVQVDSAPIIHSGRTLVPVRFVSEGLGAKVDWVEATRTVHVTLAPGTTPPSGGILTRGIGIDADTLNPLFSNNNISLWINSLTNLGLIRLDEQQEPINSLADRWSWNPSTLTYRFWLNSGVKWHDGQPFTAADVKFTFDTILNPASTNFRKGDFAALQTVTVIDDYTVDFKLARVDAPFLSRMTQGIIPAHIFAAVPVAQMAAHAYSRAPIGTGPFKLDRWVPAQTISLVAHKDYHLEGPYLDGILLKVIFDNDVMALAWENGELDWHTSLPSASASRMMVEYASKAYFKNVNTLAYEFVRPNMANPILQDVRVRQALMYALDRPALVNSLLDGRAQLMHGHQLPNSWAHTTGLNGYSLDRTKAIQLLVQAGWTTVGTDKIRTNAKGERLTFTLLTNSPHPLRADMATYLQESWRRIGVDLKVQTVNFGVLLGVHLNRSNFDLVLIGPGMQSDPDPYIYFHTSQGLVNGVMVGRNNGNWSNPEYDRLLEAGRAVEDRTERKVIYQQLDKMVNNDLPFLPLLTVIDVHGIYNKVQGIVWGLNGPIFPELLYLAR